VKVKIPWDKLEKLKKPHKAGIFAGTVVLLGVIFFFLLYQPVKSEAVSTSEEIEKLENQIMVHTKKARELNKVQEELERVKLEYEFSQRFLPEQKEVPQLLRNISDNGSQSGLNVLLFQPGKDVLKDFYAEIPFDIRLEGPYLNVTTFFDRIGRLERIVNIVGIDMGSPRYVEGEMVLNTTCKAMTFRALTEAELKAVEEAKKAATRKGKK
jgi:type IV pilus assembly protein PilO